jgi:hypothetical protein
LIRVTCAECGEDFEIGDDFAGITEFCPACGALNDIPTSQDEEEQPEEPIVHSVEDAPVRNGIPAGLWWGILVIAVGLFLAACVYLFSDNWESRNVQALSDATNRGDDFLAQENYPNAIVEYQFVLATVAHRTIESSYIQQLIERSRHGAADAEARLKAAPIATRVTTTNVSSPVTGLTAAGPTVAGPTTAPDSQILAAMTMFQRDSEGFGRFVRQHPVVFQDDKGNWRRRRYVVWGESYDEPELKQPLHISLSYNVGSQITDPHSSQENAAADDNFDHDESPRIVQCKTSFAWLDGHWTIENRDVNAQKEPTALDDIRPSLDDFFALELKAFELVRK